MSKLRANNNRPRNGFNFWLSLVLLALLVLGFAPTLYLRPLFSAAAMAGHLWFHGGVLTLWFVWLVVQTSLVRAGQPALHRRLGVVGAGIGFLTVIAGPLATLRGVRSLRARADWTADMSALPEFGVDGFTVERFASVLVWGNLASIITFAMLLAAAIALRRQRAYHSRFMLLASVSIIGPALARISRWPGLGGEDGVVIPMAFAALLGAFVVSDLKYLGHLHRATIVGVAAVVLFQLLGIAIGFTAWGTAAARSLA